MTPNTNSVESPETGRSQRARRTRLMLVAMGLTLSLAAVACGSVSYTHLTLPTIYSV